MCFIQKRYNEFRYSYSLCDGIIAGQGNGPFVALGNFVFSNNSYWLDIVWEYLYSLGIDKIPNLKAVKKLIDVKE